MTQQQRPPKDVWHQSRVMWAGILGLVFGVFLRLGFEGRADTAATVFLVVGVVCIALYLLRKFFTRR